MTTVLVYQHHLWHRGDGGAGLRLSHGGVTLLLVAGFLIGVVVGRVYQWRADKGYRPPRIVEDVRAAVSLAAASLLLVLLFGLWSLPDTGFVRDLHQFLLKYRVEDLLAAVVGFYFGSRS